MAITATRSAFSGAGANPVPFGDRWLTKTSVAFDNSYPTNGEPLTFADLGFAAEPDFVFVVGGHKGYVFDYDAANQKMLVYYGDNNNASDGPLVEVANAADLSTLTAVVVLAVGKHKL